MREGWLNDEYLIRFEPQEASAAGEHYALPAALPGHSLVGLRGWDDFIVQDEQGSLFTVPTVPLTAKHRLPFHASIADSPLQPDPRYTGKIKWYVTPIAFGGDPNLGPNLTWLTHEQHAPAVRWWNDKYREMSAGDGSA